MHKTKLSAHDGRDKSVPDIDADLTESEGDPFNLRIGCSNLFVDSAGGEDDVAEDDEAVHAGVISHRRAAENMHHA